METAPLKTENGLARSSRRTFLAKIETLFKLLAFFAFLMPFAKFVAFTSPHKPKFVTINKVLKKGGFIIDPEFILFDTDDKPIAVSRTCTHLGCKLNYHELEGMLICPCHKSRFDKKGKRYSGPARKNLPTFAVARMGGTDVTGYIVTIS